MSDSLTFPVIAVDGGAASGKSSTSRVLAQRFNLLHVDTGSHYRALTFALTQAGIQAEAPESVATALQSLQLDQAIDGQSSRIRVNGHVPREEDIRSDAVNASVSHFAAVPELRTFLFQYQRAQAEVAQREGFAGLIMEGRDIGSVIFPDAALRIFLEADEATRAARRQKEGQQDAVAERDRLDATRKTAPLTCPEGATRVDTSHMTLEQVVDHVSGLITATTALQPVA